MVRQMVQSQIEKESYAFFATARAVGRRHHRPARHAHGAQDHALGGAQQRDRGCDGVRRLPDAGAAYVFHLSAAHTSDADIPLRRLTLSPQVGRSYCCRRRFWLRRAVMRRPETMRSPSWSCWSRRSRCSGTCCSPATPASSRTTATISRTSSSTGRTSRSTEMRQGHLPLWNPHVYSGVPFLAGFQPALPLSTVVDRVPCFLTGSERISIGIALHVFLGGLWGSPTARYSRATFDPSTRLHQS